MAADPDPGGWVAVCAINRFDSNQIVCVTANDMSLIIVRDDDRFFACERACPHEQADLGQGYVKEGRLHCPRHLAWFDLSSGAISPGWSSRALRRYPVRVHDETIWINVDGLLTSGG